MADLMRQAKQPAAALDFEPEGQEDEAERPSEWAGFIYNPYSGDLLPPEDGEDKDEQDGQQGAASDSASGSRRSVWHIWLRAASSRLVQYLFAMLTDTEWFVR